MKSNNSFKIVEYSDVYQYDEQVRPFLLRNEPENNLVIGIVQILCDPTQEYFTSHYLIAVMRNKPTEICLAAVWTPIYNLALSVCVCTNEEKEQLFSSLQQYLLQKNRIITGLFAQKDDATLFAELWRQRYIDHMALPVSITTKMSEKLYELQPIDLKVDNPSQQYELRNGTDPQTNYSAKSVTNPPNRNNLIIEKMPARDYEKCLNWMVHFQQESGFYSNIPSDLIRKLNKNRLDLLVKNDCIYVLRDTETGNIVSMSAVNAETPNGGRVGWVYTPPEHRGKGYSQICVSRMCDRVFKEKKKQKMFLFADKANNAANHLYKKIGFKEVCDVDNLSFLYDSILKSNI
jgi:ribosomal protein S18 acetylase RimI-like enzyme